MKLPRRRFLRLAAGAAAIPAVSRIAKAQTYPSRPVRLIVGFGAGSASDIVARLLGEWLSERLSQQFIIENRPGAGSNTATATGARLRRPSPRSLATAPNPYTSLATCSSRAGASNLQRSRRAIGFLRPILLARLSRSAG